MSDDEWSETDEAMVMFESLSDDHPVRRAQMFFIALLDDSYGAEYLEQFVTPEVRKDWGDFSAARSSLRALDRPGIGSIANEAHGAPDVVYVKLLEHVDSGYIIPESSLIEVAGIFTMVWRPEHGAWLIHRFGDYSLPENLPRTSPGDAPPV